VYLKALPHLHLQFDVAANEETKIRRGISVVPETPSETLTPVSLCKERVFWGSGRREHSPQGRMPKMLKHLTAISYQETNSALTLEIRRLFF